ncbi:hypothetical protein AQI88_00280 [Streptomyces cellostaticus]|uniref:Uncharacterized protein n=1 Tax=Streptomyces cellostaticus TaxID=67285 RepID=A0A101NTL6_9ACTN|nr:hypothetical protein [Streptomyces cellostaticus]KUM99044.1 hypothetical protein AQI88_00280 [Streptomyces cellostaticus]GHI03487.1 hypothetical protein Scel_18080 [Streptomyces cellostaticus]
MNAHAQAPEQDSEYAALLYLSGLDHASSHSEAELRRAVAETLTALDDPAELAAVYRACLRGPGAVGDDIRRARRDWARQMADGLARTTVTTVTRRPA